MRYVMALLLLVSAAVSVPADDYRLLNERARDGIDHICASLAKSNNLSQDKETDLYIALSKAAQHDPKIENAIAFGECGNRLLKTGKTCGGLLFTLLNPDRGAEWNDLQTLAVRYKGDGVLSMVNYSTSSGRKWSRESAATFGRCSGP